MNGIRRIARNYYHVRVYATDRRCRPHHKRERAKWVRGTFTEAQRVRAKLLQRLQAELAGVGQRVTLTDFVRRWLEVREGDLRGSTKSKYVNDLERYILPTLGNFWMDELRASDVEAMLAQDPGAPNSKKNRLGLLRKINRDAMRDGCVYRDFCMGVTVKVPKVYTEIEPNSLSGRQTDRLLREIPPYWLDVAATLSFTGLRWGEVSAFHWPDIDLVEKVATVRWSQWKGILTDVKTEAGYRRIPLAGPLPELLAARKERMIAERHPGLKLGLVFPTREGGYHKGTPLRDVLNKACERAGITIRLTPHGLRRTWNNLGRRVAKGVVVRAIIGHASEAMTDHYSWVQFEEKREAAEAVAETIRGGEESRASGVSAGAGPVERSSDELKDE